MNRLDEILKRKNDEIENRKKVTIQTEMNRQASEFAKMKQTELDEEFKREALKEELKIKEIEKEKNQELERIRAVERRKKAIIKAVVKNVQSYGFVGLIIGAVIGFGKGCISYGDNYVGTGDHFLEPFRYIIPNALIICLIGVFVGIFVGISKGQNN